MESLKCTEEDNFEEYEKIFSRQFKATPKAKTIMGFEVKEPEKSAFEIALTLWDGTLPDCESGDNKRFIVYYTKNVVAPSLIGLNPLQQMAIDDILSELLDKTAQLLDESSHECSLGELKKLAGNVHWPVSAAVCKAGACFKEISLYKYIANLAYDYDP